VSNIGGDRPLRVCDLCGGVDDHPRHSLAGTVPGQAAWPAPSEDVVNQVLEAAPADCCAAAGCPADGESNCAYRIAGAEGKTGRALLNHLTKER
jgi:hypothetical protein